MRNVTVTCDICGGKDAKGVHSFGTGQILSHGVLSEVQIRIFAPANIYYDLCEGCLSDIVRKHVVGKICK